MKLFVLFMGTMFLFTTVSCSDDSDTTTDIDYAVAEAQLLGDYSQYNIADIKWSTQRGYQIAAFLATPKSRTQSQSITAWYSTVGATASLEMDSEDLGTTVPAKILEAFNATKYSDVAIWTIDEIELEHNYNENAIESYFEMDLVNVANVNLEAELFFSYKTGELLYAKEELDNDNDSDDRFVINQQLKDAVEAAFPGATIIDAEVDDNLIEVDAIVTLNGVKQEIELEFTMNYDLVSTEVETEFVYSALPVEFAVVGEWFAANTTIIPTPGGNIEVEITQGEQTEDDHSIGAYFYEVEIDEYEVGDDEYEVEFYLDGEYAIVAVVVNDIKQ